MQALLWGHSPRDWSFIQEATGQAGYDYAFQALGLTQNDSLLDIGCGSGLFCSQAASKARFVTGLDATVQLVEEARRRAPAIPFLVGEMESLGLPDEAYEVVTGFNSFQYASTISNAFAEARRVLKKGGRLVVMIWGNKEDCEAASFLKAVGSLLPPAPPGAPGPFSLSENQQLEKTLQSAGFTIKQTEDIPTVWDYPDTATALKGLLSTGPAARAIGHSGYDQVAATATESLLPFTRPDGHVVYHNKFRVVVATK